VDPSSVTLTGLASQSASVSFTVAQQAQAAGSGWKGMSLVLAMLVPFGLIGRRSRKWRAIAACLLLVFLLPIGCGVASSAGNDSGGGGGGGTSPGSPYTLTVTGSMPGLTRTATTQINVE